MSALDRPATAELQVPDGGDLCDRCHTEGGVKFLPLDEPADYVCVGCMTPAERKATGWV